MSVKRVSWAASIALSSCLFFVIQPMIAKSLLPEFGGAAGVWITCLMFFQLVLLGGYSYAFLLSKVQSQKHQLVIHGVLLSLTLLWLSIGSTSNLGTDESSKPLVRLLFLLIVEVGAPSVLLCATSPLLQHWWGTLVGDGKPYTFYSLSNAASLFGLAIYPLYLERFFSLENQRALWVFGYLLFFLATVSVLCLLAFRQNPFVEHLREKAQPLRLRLVGYWIILSFTGTVILLSISQYITIDIAPFPLFWVVPLGLYLLTYVFAFSIEGVHLSNSFRCLVLLALVLWGFSLARVASLALWQEILISLSSLFVFCTFLHGELASSKPKQSKLTTFYVVIAFGGSLGGVFVSVIAPNLFNSFHERSIGLLLVYLLALFCMGKDGLGKFASFSRGMLIVLGLMGVVGYSFLSFEQISSKERVLYGKRNFYGRSIVYEREIDDGATVRVLQHGTIEHGAQIFDRDGRGATSPVSYYSPLSGIGELFAFYNRFAEEGSFEVEPIQVVAVGLGTGAISSYLRRGDFLQYFEINPAVVNIATQYFTYLSKSPVAERITLADGRLGLEHALAENGPFQADIVILDAFNSDSIPTHLLTREAFELYWKHLKPDGVLAVLFDSNLADLLPVVAANAAILSKHCLLLSSEGVRERGIRAVSWTLVTSNERLLRDARFEGDEVRERADVEPWTDSFSDVWSVIRWNRGEPLPAS